MNIPSAVSSLHIEFPEHLPVSAERHAIMQAIAAHQVVIVCGETGSGKTTQLPKMLLALGYGKINGKRLIGHTQPRRIAASSVAARLADEIRSPLGEVVGFKVRFHDRLSKDASVKLMTDGILLAETQTDPLLKAYDVIIIDEAHERSLNIDFLLGYLKQLLPKRPDLKLVITSATIDAERFAKHFAQHDIDAPVFMVSGRTYPVDIKWRAFEESKDTNLQTAIGDAVDELWSGHRPTGDILVFLPGEREIRDAADYLREHLSHQPLTRETEIIPLFARLSSAEQDRVFKAHSKPRIVLSTNVAETSLTVPGIRYVIDSGLARVKRYSYRQKIEQLQIEAVSQAAANQRSGRCGRVSDGVAIRLYDEKDFLQRAPFTDPEILRSSLAAVILRMKALKLGAIESFPFIDPPRTKAIHDGYQLLQELGALNEQLELTDTGLTMSKLPLDPRIARMILEAQRRGCLNEVLIIASAMSVQDVRDRPMEYATKADQAHRQFEDDRSEFVSMIKLWDWIHHSRGGDGHTHKLSNRQFDQLLKDHWIHARRAREWRDVYQQVHTVVAEHGWKLNSEPASYDILHQTLLSGLLGQVGCRHESEPHYLGPRGIKFWPHPGSRLSKKPARWLMSGELVETTRVFGRSMASIEPHWIEQVGSHLIVREVGDPRWDMRSGRVVASERGSLYGLVIYSQRQVDFSRINPTLAREVFIREALVNEQINGNWPFIDKNRRTLKQIEKLEHKSRRQDVLVDDEWLFSFYNDRIPADVVGLKTLEDWYRKADSSKQQALLMTPESLMRHKAESVTAQRFPDLIRMGGIDCHAHYLHQPGHERDGLTVDVPLYVLNQIQEDRCEWLVPGMLPEKILLLLKGLQQRPRSRLLPLTETATRITEEWLASGNFGHANLFEQLANKVKTITQLDIRASDFKPDQLPMHMRMGLRLLDEHGRQLMFSRSLSSLRGEWGQKARGAFQSLAQLQVLKSSAPSLAIDSNIGSASATHKASKLTALSDEKWPTGASAEKLFTAWEFDELPEIMEVRQGGKVLVGFPALVDQGHGVCLEVFDEPEIAQQKHRIGLERLFAIACKDNIKYLEKNIPEFQPMSMAYMSLGTAQELKDQILQLAIRKAFQTDQPPTNTAEFQERLLMGKPKLSLLTQEVTRIASHVLLEWAHLQKRLKDSKWPEGLSQDVRQQLQRMVHKRFLIETSSDALGHLPRYLKAIHKRLDKFKADPNRDASLQKEVASIEQRYWKLVQARQGKSDSAMVQFRWLIEELRVSLFAQELRTPQPVSVKRLEKAWSQFNT